MPRTKTIEEAFWPKVDRRGPSECWPWIGSRNEKGYGLLRRKSGSVRASRVAWALHNKQEFPADRFACHTCDNPSCVNPLHIWPGSPQENSQDALRKDRLLCGPKARLAALSAPSCGHSDIAYYMNEGRMRPRCRTCNRAAKARYAARQAGKVAA